MEFKKAKKHIPARFKRNQSPNSQHCEYEAFNSAEVVVSEGTQRLLFSCPMSCTSTCNCINKTHVSDDFNEINSKLKAIKYH